MLLIETVDQVKDIMIESFAEYCSESAILELIECKLKHMLPGDYRKDFLLMTGLLQTLIDSISDFPQFLVDKHKKYGAEPLMFSKQPGIIDRMIHKLYRIKNLRQLGEDSLPDIQAEIVDLLGYSIIGYLLTIALESSAITIE